MNDRYLITSLWTDDTTKIEHVNDIAAALSTAMVYVDHPEIDAIFIDDQFNKKVVLSWKKL